MSGKSNYFQTEFTISVTKRDGERDIVLLADDEDHCSSDDDVIPVSFTNESTSFKREERLSPSHVEESIGGPPSMASSSASVRRLEWDSGADVGYDDPNASIKKEHLSTVERLALGAAVFTRSEPEGGTNQEDPPSVSVVSMYGPPDASSTPRAPTDRPLSPNIIVQNFGGISDSDDKTRVEPSQPVFPPLSRVKSSSLDNAQRKNRRFVTSTYPRCSNDPLPPQAPSTSSSSSVTVVKRQPGSKNVEDPSDDSPHSSGLAGDRANSFEYLPGRVYEEESKDCDQLFQNDLDKGVELLAEFLKNVNIDSDQRKRRLIKDVVDCLLAKNYPGDSDLNASDEPQQENRVEAESPKPETNTGTSSSSRHEDSSKSTEKDTTPPPVESAKTFPEVKRASPEVLCYIRNEKQKQLNWIKTEINHLKNLKELLEQHESLKHNFNLYKRQRVKDYREKLRTKMRENEEKVREERKNADKIQSESEHNFSESTWNSHSHKLGGQLKKNASTNTTLGRRPPAVPTASCPPPPPPKSVAYTITFDRQPPSSRSSRNATSRDDIFIAERDQLIATSRDHVRTVHVPPPPPPAPLQPLQTQLLTKNPRMIAQAEFRRRAVAELAALRELRVENKGRILTAALNGEPLDPVLTNPLKYKRAVSNTSMKRLTEKHYRKTTEVQTRKLQAKLREEKQTNRLMAQIFNAKLQKKVLRGETHLPNTVNVITC